jgi:hypothetical protein
MRKKYESYKNIRRKEENFQYFLFEVDDGIRTEVFIHLETQLIENEDEYFGNKIDAIYDKYKPKLVEIEVSPLGKWEYNALKQSGAETLLELWSN